MSRSSAKMDEQWILIALAASIAGFIAGRWWWTLSLAPLPFVAWLGFYQSNTFCRNAGGSLPFTTFGFTGVADGLP